MDVSNKKLRAKRILSKLSKHYPNANMVLTYSNNFELLVAVMLSAQTTDIQVNKTTALLFPKYRKQFKEFTKKYIKYKNLNIPKTELIEIVNFSNINLKLLARDIRSIGLYKNKAKNINASAKILLKDYHGIFPRTITDMIKFPGVGRKTANVFLGQAYGIVEGIAVDTHVKKLSLKYGFTNKNDPEKIEKDLMELFDKKDWLKLTSLLIAHGRAVGKLKKDFIVEKDLL